MKVKYYLVDNPMTEDPNDFRAQVSGYAVVTEKELFEYITRKGSGVTTAEVMGNYCEIIEAHEYFMKQGFGINTEFINARPTIQGVFKDRTDGFDSSRHNVKFKVRFGKRYNQVAKDVKTEKMDPVVNAPSPYEFEDILSGTKNETITPNGVAVIKGSRLKFDNEDVRQGIFFMNNETETRVSKVITSQGSQAVFMIPDSLAAGDYTVELRILPNGNKDVKKGQLEDKLTV